MIRARLLATLLPAALAVAPGAAAQWSAVPSTATTESGSDAVVRNEQGAELRIWLDPDANLRAAFSLPPGLIALDPEGCPTLRVDEVPAEDLSRAPHECSVSGERASVLLARVEQGQVDSATLLNLMNGSRLVVRYRTAHAGYGAMEFSLRGSKQALSTAIGDGVTVVGE